MARQVVPLTGDVWDAIEAPCRTCLFWEVGERPGRDVDVDRDLIRKQAWTTARLRDGLPPGRAVLVDDEVAGIALFAPLRDFENNPAGMPTPSEDALVLATMWLDPGHRNRGLGRLLLQEAIKQAIHQHLAAVEVRADRRWRPDNCVLPITWLLHEGFEVAVEHPRWPLLRLEVSRTVRWSETVEQAVNEMLGRLPRRTSAPRPAVDSGTENFALDDPGRDAGARRTARPGVTPGAPPPRDR